MVRYAGRLVGGSLLVGDGLLLVYTTLSVTALDRL